LGASYQIGQIVGNNRHDGGPLTFADRTMRRLGGTDPQAWRAAVPGTSLILAAAPLKGPAVCTHSGGLPGGPRLGVNAGRRDLGGTSGACSLADGSIGGSLCRRIGGRGVGKR
jgi:hypothetical protein